MGTVVLWFGAVANLFYAVTGGGWTPRPESALLGLACGAVASWMTWIGVLFLQRPVIREDGVYPEEQREAELRSPGYAARAENDRRAWRSR